jgi:hypothetical protein
MQVLILYSDEIIPRNHLFASIADRAISGRRTKNTAAHAVISWTLDADFSVDVGIRTPNPSLLNVWRLMQMAQHRITCLKQVQTYAGVYLFFILWQLYLQQHC